MRFRLLPARVSCVLLCPSLLLLLLLCCAAVGGFVAGDVKPLKTFGELNSCELGVFQF